MIRVLIADDHPFVLAGVAALLSGIEDIQVVAQCVDGGEALRTAEALQPDVVLMDVDMPVLSGYEATEKLRVRAPSVRVLIMSVSIITGGGPESAYQAGAHGYLVKGDATQVIAAI